MEASIGSSSRSFSHSRLLNDRFPIRSVIYARNLRRLLVTVVLHCRPKGPHFEASDPVSRHKAVPLHVYLLKTAWSHSAGSFKVIFELQEIVICIKSWSREYRRVNSDIYLNTIFADPTAKAPHDGLDHIPNTPKQLPAHHNSPGIKFFKRCRPSYSPLSASDAGRIEDPS